MKSRILLIVAVASVGAAQLQAVVGPPSVPDSGGTAGILALGLIAVIALRRKFTK